jgi:hypothetical protein
MIDGCNANIFAHASFLRSAFVWKGISKLQLREELHNLYSWPIIIRMIRSRMRRCAEHVARMKQKRNAYRMLVGKPKGKSPLGRPRRRWVNNVKMDLREVGWGGMDWIDLAPG